MRVIYTALIGGYDQISPIKSVSGYDCIMFTDMDLSKAPRNMGWKFVKADLKKGKNNTLVNRWYKMHAHILFPYHQSSIYIDANIQIDDMSDIDSRVSELEKSGVNIAVSDHIFRHCIYEEAEAVAECGKDSRVSVDNTLVALRADNYPKNNGLYENNFIFRKHHDQQIINLMECWWEFINQYSSRDQLSLCYLLWREGMESTYFFGRGIGVRNHKGITFNQNHLIKPVLVRGKIAGLNFQLLIFLCKLVPGKAIRIYLRELIKKYVN